MALKKPVPKTPRQEDQRTHPRNLEGLLAQLTGSGAEERRWAARDLAAFPAAAVPLCRQLAEEPDPSVREVILTTLIGFGDEQTVQGLIPLLRSQDAPLRNGAIYALQNLPEAVAPHMETLLTDPDPDVRIFAINVLESLRHPGTPHWLVTVVERDDHVNVCATAVDLLAEVGIPESVPALEGLKARFPDEPFMAFAVDLALRRIRDGA